MAHDPRRARLEREWDKLRQLTESSDHVRVEPLGVRPGFPPESYRITFLCRGIIGIDGSQNPIYADEHRVLLTITQDFPSDPPALRWETPIWHPNIHHAGRT